MISTITHTFISYIHRTDIFIVDKIMKTLILFYTRCQKSFRILESTI